MIILPLFLLIGLALWLARYLVGHDRGEREPMKALWTVFGLGFLGAVIAVFAEGLLPSRYVTGDHPPFGMGLLLASLGIGIIEEVCKFVPAALYIYKKRFFNEHTDGIIYFAIAGLGFGLPENLLYVLQYGTSVGLVRVVLTPFFHSAMTGMVGYFLIRTKLRHKPKSTVGMALAAAAVLHGLYDFGLFSRRVVPVLISLCITFGATVTLFLLYRHATRDDQNMGLSAVGNNNFCRSCGLPNPKHYLYCQRCGKHA